MCLPRRILMKFSKSHLVVFLPVHAAPCLSVIIFAVPAMERSRAPPSHYRWTPRVESTSKLPLPHPPVSRVSANSPAPPLCFFLFWFRTEFSLIKCIHTTCTVHPPAPKSSACFSDTATCFLLAATSKKSNHPYLSIQKPRLLFSHPHVLSPSINISSLSLNQSTQLTPKFPD